MDKGKQLYFYKIADVIAQKSVCLSRKVGAVLVKNGVIIATGYNGPARNVKHCIKCVRRAKQNYQSATNLSICASVHAEANCIANAARVGTSTEGSALIINTVTPCKDCLSLLINAGVKDVYALDGWYDELSTRIVREGSLTLFRIPTLTGLNTVE